MNARPGSWGQNLALGVSAALLILGAVVLLQAAFPGLIWPEIKSAARVTDWALVGLTAVYVVVTSLQFMAMRRTLYAVTRQARIIRDTERRQLRAYVGVQEAAIQVVALRV